MFEYSYKLNDDDYYQFNLYYLYNDRQFKRNTLWLRWLTPAALLSVVLIYLALSTDINDMPQVIFKTVFLCITVIIITLWIVFFNSSIKSSIKKSIKNSEKNGKLPYSSEGTIKFDDDKIIDTTKRGEISVYYSSVEKICMSSSALYIYFNLTEAFILPFSVFKNNEEKNALLDFLKTKTNLDPLV